ncbi:HNH endonuclease [Dactylosporangium sp. NPDC049140]|uniref:HNH endonuclease n=1 Tax=Dactylosporangium sp. NPDC049140 TaxID=3155647 RepID=UPI0033FBFBBD
MTFADVTRAAVLEAVADFGQRGSDEFLRVHGFGPAKAYFLNYNDRLYDSKAIFGVAHGISGDRPWRSEDFTGGDKTVAERLRVLGFAVDFLRNPDWTRDEIILVCAAVEANGWRTVAQENPVAIGISGLLQAAAIHPAHGRRSDFRNPASVERKSGDLVSRHPDFRGRPTNGDRLDAEVVRDFLTSPVEMRTLAESIRATLRDWDEDAPVISELDVDDTAADEGGVLLREHLRRERDPGLKAKKLEDARRRGIVLACEACGFDFHRTYGPRGKDYIECHHRTPLGVTGRTRTRLADLALICSNCHRMIHRTRDWLTVEQLACLVDNNRNP